MYQCTLFRLNSTARYVLSYLPYFEKVIHVIELSRAPFLGFTLCLLCSLRNITQGLTTPLVIRVSLPTVFFLREGVTVGGLCIYSCIKYCYITRLLLNKMSTVIGWFLVTCLWSNSNVSRPGYNCAVVVLTPSLFAFAVGLFKGKSSYITKHLMYGPSGN